LISESVKERKKESFEALQYENFLQGSKFCPISYKVWYLTCKSDIIDPSLKQNEKKKSQSKTYEQLEVCFVFLNE